MKQTVFAADRLVDFGQKLLVAGGMPDDDANISAVSLVASNLRGVDTHGVRFAPVYAGRMRSGTTNPAARVKIDRRGPSALFVSGDNGEGHYVASLAMKETIEVAREQGACATVIRDTNHVGMLAYFVEMASSQGLIGHATTNGESYVAPTGGLTPILSTNPMAWAIPARENPDIVVDMATTTVANSKIVEAATRGENIPLTWGFDAEGKPTDDPVAVKSGGTLQPLGGYKGYALMLVADVLAGVMSGGPFSTDLHALGDNHPQGIGMYVNVIDPGRFLNSEAFSRRVDDEIERLRGSELAEGVDRIRYPGELESETRTHRSQHGVPISDEHMSVLNEGSMEFDVPMPEPLGA